MFQLMLDDLMLPLQFMLWKLTGPSFGTGKDFRISHMSNMNNNSYSKFGANYQFPSEYTDKSFNASNYLTGCMKMNFTSGFCFFSTVEIKVYQLI